jgi:hypothetical protein
MRTQPDVQSMSYSLVAIDDQNPDFTYFTVAHNATSRNPVHVLDFSSHVMHLDFR